MSLRTAILPALSQIDSIMGPNVLDLRASQIHLIQRTWPQGLRGKGTPIESEPKVFPNWIKIRHVTQREIAGSGGRYEEGDVICGPFRPSFVDQNGVHGGFSETDLDPPCNGMGIENVYVLSQTDPTGTGVAGEYKLKELRRDRSLRYMLVLGRLRTTP